MKPINVLPTKEKVMESVVYRVLLKHNEDDNILCDNQLVSQKL